MNSHLHENADTGTLDEGRFPFTENLDLGILVGNFRAVQARICITSLFVTGAVCYSCKPFRYSYPTPACAQF